MMIFRLANQNFRSRHPGNGIVLDTSDIEDYAKELELAIAFISSGVPLEYWHCNPLGEGEWIPVPTQIRTAEQLHFFTQDPWHPV
jgi:hypothetical protein